MSAMVRIFSLGERWRVPIGTLHLSPHENILTIARVKTFMIFHRSHCGATFIVRHLMRADACNNNSLSD